MSAWTCRHSDGQADPKIVPPRPRIPQWKGLGADSEEKREPVSDIDTVVVDSLKVLDLKWPIREADIGKCSKAQKSLQQSTRPLWGRGRKLHRCKTGEAQCAGRRRRHINYTSAREWP